MKKLFTLAVVTALLLLIGSGAAFAQTTATATATLQLNGTYSISFVPGNVVFPATTIPAVDTPVYATSPVATIVVLGQTTPWHVTYQCSALTHTTEGAAPTFPVSMRSTASGLTGGVVGDTATVSYPLSTHTVITSAQTVYSVDGMKRGTMTYTPTAQDLRVTVTPDAYSGPHQGTLTATIIMD